VSANIDDLRSGLPAVSDVLWSALGSFGVVPDDTVRLFHCPMANDGAGANWLQKSAQTANPYFGLAMPGCGSQIDVLSNAAAKEER